MKAQPCGVIAILTAPDGHVVAHAACFSPSRCGGMNVQRSQEARAGRLLAGAVIAQLCSNVLSSVLDDYECDRLVDALIQRGKYQKNYIAIGHDAGGGE